jgi:hypothetical protein
VSDPGRALVLRTAETDLQVLAGIAAGGVVKFRTTTKLDAICEAVGDDALFAEMLNEQVQPALRPTLLSGRFDLPSSSLLAANPVDVVAALVAMVITETPESIAPIDVDEECVDYPDDIEVSSMGLWVFKAAAEYLRVRDDWDEVLEVVVDIAPNDEGRTLSDWLYAALYFEAGCPEYVRDGRGSFDGEPADGLSLDLFEQLGLDGDVGLARIVELVDSDTMPRFDRSDFLAARQRFNERQGSIRATARSAEAEREAATAAADDIDV